MTNYNKEIVDKIKEIVLNHRKSFAIVLKSKKYTDLFNYIESMFNFNIKLSEKLFLMFNDLTSRPKCKVCGIKEISKSIRCDPIDGYKTYCCSISCSQKDPDYRKKLEERNLVKHGVKYYQQTTEYKNELKEKLKTLPKEHFEKANKKRIETCLEKYGTENISQIEQIKNKKIDTFNCKSDKEKQKIIDKTKQTKLNRYGNKTFNNKEQAKKTRLKNKKINKNYDKDINNKRRKTCLEKYNVEYPVLLKKAKENASNARRNKTFDQYINKNDHVIPLFSKDEYLKFGLEREFSWKCKKCNDIFKSKVYEHQLYVARCKKCYPLNSSISQIEKEISDWLKTEYLGNIILGSRQIIAPYELDIYIPEKKLAIEFNGLYWHSIDNKGKRNYHLNKTELCEKQGIQLIHIFENEWILKQDIVKSRIKNILGIHNKTVFARKCKVKKIKPNESSKFLEKNHIQGAVGASVHLGLFYEDKLISVMTFGKARFSKKYEYELVRFCSKLNYNIPGASGKLLKYFERNYIPKSIVSYADRRWSKGKMYKALDFDLSHLSQPNYWYWKYSEGSMILESRLKYQKHKLESLLKKYDPNLSEYRNMLNNGYLRIFDCGNLVYEKLNLTK